MKTSIVVLLNVAFAMLLSAQTVSIPAGDPDVFAAFLRMNHAIGNGTGATGSSSDTVTAANSSGVPAAHAGWRQELGISDADFSKIEPVYLSLKNQLDSLRSDALAYATTAAAGVDPAVLASFRTRELSSINSAATVLKSQLTSTGSAALFAFIDGRFRAAVTRAPIGKAR